MSLVFKLIIISMIYLFINTDIFYDFVLSKIPLATTADGNTTNKGEIVKYIVFIVAFIALDVV